MADRKAKVEPKKEHGPETACYSHDGITYRPIFVCLCGWTFRPGEADTWEEAGAMFDEHLEDHEGR